MPAFSQTKPTPAPPAASKAPRALAIINKAWTGDFDGMLKRHAIRVAVPYSRTLYFNDKGQERGVTAELVRDFERYINTKYAKELKKRPLTVYIVPTTRDKLLPELVAGNVDIAAGNLTATAERLEIVDFLAPHDRKPVSELVVSEASLPPVAAAADLSGKTVHVRKASSYYESLEALNETLSREKKPPVQIMVVPDSLEDEDMMEMVNAGLIDYVVVDDWKARSWSKILPKVRVDETAILRQGAYVGWAIRKKSPELTRVLEEYYKDHVKKLGIAEVLMARYTKRIKQIGNNKGTEEWKRFEAILALFRKYGQEYGFDPIMLAAQGFQESRLDQNAKSHVGAIGVMQIMPATGAELKVGNIHEIEPNIHGSAKYMDQLMTRYFPDAKFTPDVRPLFAFASYNAGPGNIAKMRKEAEKRGLDPNLWFNNVEVVVAEKIGIETTTYVRNIYKYYAAYKLTLATLEEHQKALDAIEKPKS